MEKRYWSSFSIGIAAVFIVSSSIHAQQTSSPDLDEKAMAILGRMATFLAQTQNVSATQEIGFDIVQQSGQKIEFGETRKLVIKRPNHIRVDTIKREGPQARFSFDGQTIAVFTAKENVYATIAKPGSLDEALSYFVQDLDMRLPLAELFYNKLSEGLKQRVQVADLVGQTTVAGVACEHVAIRTARVDVQMWIAQGEQPLLQRIVITYREENGQPQFWAQFRDWNLTPEIEDSFFHFSPPEGAAQINIVPGGPR